MFESINCEMFEHSILISNSTFVALCLQMLHTFIQCMYIQAVILIGLKSCLLLYINIYIFFSFPKLAEPECL